MKSLPVPVAQARSNFSEVLDDARKGRRIRLTRHGKPIGWLIGQDDRARLEEPRRGKNPRSKRSAGR